MNRKNYQNMSHIGVMSVTCVEGILLWINEYMWLPHLNYLGSQNPTLFLENHKSLLIAFKLYWNFNSKCEDIPTENVSSIRVFSRVNSKIVKIRPQMQCLYIQKRSVHLFLSPGIYSLSAIPPNILTCNMNSEIRLKENNG